jgi:hypothetical protein
VRDRIVEGYYFVNQVIRERAYDPKDSLRKGRGSFQEFPFSWCYTALGYRNVRSYLGLPKASQTQKDPIDEKHLEESGNLLTFMFGASGVNAAIDDSRKIGRLAKALSNDDAIDSLLDGETVDDALDQLKPLSERTTESFRRADKALKETAGLLSGKPKFDAESISVLEDLWESVDSRVETLGNQIDDIKRPRRNRSQRNGKS